jgi:urea transporter/murein DD-endopeptidase MepM/ murein hydrolase activator NlpD
VDLVEKWEGVLDSLLLSYSQVLFSRDRWVGAIILTATAMRQDLFFFGLMAVFLANGFAFSLHLSKNAIKKGMFGYNGLLIGLAFPFLFKITAPLVVLFVMAVFATTLVTAALHAALGYYFNLPVLTLPFLVVMYLVLAAFPSIQGMAWNTQSAPFYTFAFSMPEMAEAYFKSLGAIFFAPHVVSGVIIFIALLIFSRIGTLLSFVGYAIGVGLIRWVFHFPSEHLYLSIGFNFILSAIAMGGIWFVPQTTSFLFAGGAVLLCAVILAGTANLFYFFGFPVLILPFNLTVLILLYGMRQRIVDRHPKSVDFLLGTPEANATYYRTRLARFGANFAHQISLPFLGTWTCTQGHVGGLTHEGPWEHAFDFEVRDQSGRFYKNEGKEISDYFCYKLPILACCDGQVVKTVNHLPENPIGKLDLKQNWGNLVMIKHGPSLFSMACHLAEGSVKVKEGDIVREGDIIGYCGNSGRSAIPHLHFQLQNSARVGAPTIHSEFHEMILEGASPFLHSTYVPGEGDAVRNVRRQEEIADYFSLLIGQKISLACHFENKVWEETIVSTIDLYGNLKLVSLTKKAVLDFENKNRVFVVYDYQGCKDSALFVLYISVPRAPYELAEDLTYSDTLPARHFLSWGERVLSDFIAPFFSPKGRTIFYRCQRRGSDFTISGSSADKTQQGIPRLETMAIFREGQGWVGGYLIQGRKKFEVMRKRDLLQNL